MTILIRGTKIAQIAPSSDTELPPDAQVFDLSGRFLIPGLIDAHVHMPDSPFEDLERVLPFLRDKLHAGITTVRDMGGDARFLGYAAREARRGRIESPDIHYSAAFAGPRFFPPDLDLGPAWGRAAGIRRVDSDSPLERMVIESMGTGATGIKLYGHLPAGAVTRIVETAHENGLRVWAHAALLPARPSDGVDAGVDVVSHAALLTWEAVDPLPEWDRTAMFGEAHLASLDWREPVSSLLEEMAGRGTMLDPTWRSISGNPTTEASGDRPPPAGSPPRS